VFGVWWWEGSLPVPPPVMTATMPSTRKMEFAVMWDDMLLGSVGLGLECGGGSGATGSQLLNGGHSPVLSVWGMRRCCQRRH